MKRIIDIPYELYKKIMEHRALTKYQEHIDYENLKDMIEDSTPLNGCQAEDFIKYAKDNYGIELTLKESDNPDTFEKLFGTTKNDLGVDCISRQAVIDELKRYFHDEYYQRTSIQDCRDCFIEDVLKHLPSVTPQEPSRDMKEIEEVINCDVDAETKCKMISNILTAKPHYFEEPQESEG